MTSQPIPPLPAGQGNDSPRALALLIAPAAADTTVGTALAQAIAPLGGVPAATTFLRDHPDGLLLVLADQPRDLLAAALETGTPLDTAVATCLAALQPLHDLIAAHPGRVLLIDHAAARHVPAALAQTLQDNFGIAAPDLSALDPDSPTAADRGLRALATLALDETPEAHPIQAALSAARLPFGTPDPAPTLARDLDHLRQRAAALESELATLARIEATMSQRNLDLLRDIATLESAQARAAGEQAATHEETGRTAGQIADLTARIAELESSTSWRLTAPLRAVSRALSGSGRRRD